MTELEQSTLTQWGVLGMDGETVVPMPKYDAEAVCRRDPESRIMRRAITYGPWRCGERDADRHADV